MSEPSGNQPLMFTRPENVARFNGVEYVYAILPQQALPGRAVGDRVVVMARDRTPDYSPVRHSQYSVQDVEDAAPHVRVSMLLTEVMRD